MLAEVSRREIKHAYAKGHNKEKQIHTNFLESNTVDLRTSKKAQKLEVRNKKSIPLFAKLLITKG